MDTRREELFGFSDPHDRLWEVTTPGFKACITDYNWELTGYDSRLHAIDPKVFHYSGNAYYITGAYARARGWTVKQVED